MASVWAWNTGLSRSTSSALDLTSPGVFCVVTVSPCTPRRGNRRSKAESLISKRVGWVSRKSEILCALSLALIRTPVRRSVGAAKSDTSLCTDWNRRIPADIPPSILPNSNGTTDSLNKSMFIAILALIVAEVYPRDIRTLRIDASENPSARPLDTMSVIESALLKAASGLLSFFIPASDIFNFLPLMMSAKAVPKNSSRVRFSISWGVRSLDILNVSLTYVHTATSHSWNCCLRDASRMVSPLFPIRIAIVSFTAFVFTCSSVRTFPFSSVVPLKLLSWFWYSAVLETNAAPLA